MRLARFAKTDASFGLFVSAAIEGLLDLFLVRLASTADRAYCTAYASTYASRIEVLLACIVGIGRVAAGAIELLL